MIDLGFVKARNPSGPAKVDSMVRPETARAGMDHLTKSPVAASFGSAKRQILVQLKLWVSRRIMDTKNQSVHRKPQSRLQRPFRI